MGLYTDDIWIVECSAMKNRGVNEAFTEAARVALQDKSMKNSTGGAKGLCGLPSACRIM